MNILKTNRTILEIQASPRLKGEDHFFVRRTETSRWSGWEVRILRFIVFYEKRNDPHEPQEVEPNSICLPRP
jgi:hypothetical protein